jgi:N4-gp56 family major capsid protein
MLPWKFDLQLFATLNVMKKVDVDLSVPEKWELKIRLDAARKAFWNKFEGAEGSNMPIIIKNDFTKEPGDVIHIDTVSQILNEGVTGETTLAGSETKFSLGQFDLTVDWLRNAIAYTKKADKESFLNVAMTISELLSSWMARQLDSDMFNRLIVTDAPDVIYANNKTSEESLVTTDTFQTAELDALKLALIRKGAIPIRTIQDNKQERPVFGVVISEVDEYYLKQDANWIKRNSEAATQGTDNPMFTGALGMWNGVLVYTHSGISGLQGTPLRPEGSIYGAHTALATIITVGANDGNNYTKFFTPTGTISIMSSGGLKEFVSYTGKNFYSFTGCTRGATYGGSTGDGARAYTGGELVTQSNYLSIQLAFGAEIAARGWGQYPKEIRQVEDYGFENGLGIEAVFGQAAIKNKAGQKPNYLIMKSFAQNPSAKI